MLKELNLLYVKNEKNEIILLENNIIDKNREFLYNLKYDISTEEVHKNFFMALKSNEKIIFNIDDERNIEINNSDSPAEITMKISKELSKEEKKGSNSKDLTNILVSIIERILDDEIHNNPDFRKSLIRDYKNYLIEKDNITYFKKLKEAILFELSISEVNIKEEVQYYNTSIFMGLKENYTAKKINTKYFTELIFNLKEILTKIKNSSNSSDIVDCLKSSNIYYIPTILINKSLKESGWEDTLLLVNNYLNARNIKINVPFALLRGESKTHLRELLKFLLVLCKNHDLGYENTPITVFLELLKLNDSEFIKEVMTELITEYKTSSIFFIDLKNYLGSINWMWNYEKEITKLFDIILAILPEDKTILWIIKCLMHFDMKNMYVEKFKVDRSLYNNFINLSIDKIKIIYNGYSEKYLKFLFKIIKFFISSNNTGGEYHINNILRLTTNFDNNYLSEVFMSNGNKLLAMIILIFRNSIFESLQDSDDELEKEIINNGLKILMSDIGNSEKQRIIRILATMIHENSKDVSTQDKDIILFINTLSNLKIRNATIKKIFELPEKTNRNYKIFYYGNLKRNFFFGKDYTEFTPTLLSCNSRDIITSVVLQLGMS